MLHVGVDLSGGFGRGCPVDNSPCARLVLSGGEERAVVEQFVSGADHALKAAFRCADVVQESLRLVGFERGEFLLEFRADRDDFHAVSGGVVDQRLRRVVLAERPEPGLVDVGADERGHGGEQLERRHHAAGVRIVLVPLRNPAVFEVGDAGLGELVFRLDLRVAGAQELLALVESALEEFQVGEHEFGQDQLQVARRIDGAAHMHHVAVLKETHHVRHGVDVADMPEELVAEAFALAGALDESGDVDELQRRRHDARGFFDVGENAEAVVRHGHDARVRFNGAEREIRGGRASVGQSVEKGGFPDVGKTDKTAGKPHGVKLRVIM